MENHRENRIKIIIDQKMDGWLVEKVLRQALGVSRTLLRRAKRQEGILLNGEPVYSNVRVMPGQRLELVLAAEESRVMPQKLDLEIIYEDRDILAVNKPPRYAGSPPNHSSRGNAGQRRFVPLAAAGDCRPLQAGAPSGPGYFRTGAGGAEFLCPSTVGPANGPRFTNPPLPGGGAGEA